MRVVAFLVAFLVVALPSVADARLVPVACDAPGTCGTCEFVELINNVIQFVLRFASIAATMMIVYGGFKMVVSGGDVGAKTKAKEIVTNVIIGYVIALSAFLVINTLLAALIGGEAEGTQILNWQQIECVYPSEPKYNPLTYGLAAKDSITDINILDYGPSGGNGAGVQLNDYFVSANNSMVCSQPFLTHYFGNAASQAACIASKESACGGSIYSVTDRDANGRAFSIGAFQINMTVHTVEGCSGIGAETNYLPCHEAYQGSNYSAVVVDDFLYRACVQALANPQCSAKNAARIRAGRDGSWRDWSTAEACGL